jgi:hypothetical protein
MIRIGLINVIRRAAAPRRHYPRAVACVANLVSTAALTIVFHSSAFGTRPIIANYAGELRESTPRSDGYRHIDTPAMIDRLKALHVNAYFFLVWHSPRDWDDFRDEFLPMSAKAGIDVWVYLVPPTECKPTCSLPFGNDYVRWAAEIASLSLKEPKLKGMAIDDFDYNAASFSPDYTYKVRQAGKAINSKFLFYPLLYWPAIESPNYFERYAPAIDGFIFAYRDDPNTNTVSTETLSQQLSAAEVKSSTYGKPFLLMVYCDSISNDSPPPDAAYIKAVVAEGLAAARAAKAEGVVTYDLDLEDHPLSESANPAHHGSGYGVIMIHGATAPEAHGELRCRLRIQPNVSSYLLTFWHKNSAAAEIPRGVLFAQLIIGSVIVWEQDIKAGASTWKSEKIKVPPTATNPTAMLRFVVTNKTGADVRLTADFDDMEIKGFSVADPDFENPQAWESYRTNPAFRETVQIFDVDQPRRVFQMLGEMYLQALRDR